LIVLAVLSAIGGFINIPQVFTRGGERLTEFLSPVVPNAETTVTHSTEWMLMGLTTVIAVVAILIAWGRYKTYKDEQPSAVARFLQNKWYVDELYDSIIVKPLNALGSFANTALEKSGIDGLVNGVGRAVNYSGRQLRWLQSGQVGSYVLLMVISMVIFFVLEFFLKK
jgi:NADH-quinone oxidoreductase subunit L